MTPKEKAEEMYDSFRLTNVIGLLNKRGKLVSPYKSFYFLLQIRDIRAKSCATLCVREILEIYLPGKEHNFWQEVLSELEKL